MQQMLLFINIKVKIQLFAINPDCGFLYVKEYFDQKIFVLSYMVAD